MNTKIKSVKCNLVINDNSISSVVTQWNDSDINASILAVCKASMLMVKNFKDSKNSGMAMGNKHSKDLSAALTYKITEYVNAGGSADKSINLRFTDDNNVSHKIVFKLSKKY